MHDQSTNPGRVVSEGTMPGPLPTAEPSVRSGVAKGRERALRVEAAQLAIAASAASGGTASTRAADDWLAFLEDGSTTEPRERGTWAPTQPDGDPEEHREFLERTVGEALGAASVAWTGGTRGVFESAYVSGIVDTLMAAIDRYADEAKAWGRDRAQDVHKPRAEAWDALWQIVGGGELTDLASAQQRIIDRLRDGEPQPPAHGLAVGDELTPDQMRDAPTGLVVKDADGDLWARTNDPGRTDPDEVWQTFYPTNETEPYGAHYSIGEFSAYAPFTVHALPEPAEAPNPEPEDTTPRVGDTVRVREGAEGVERQRDHSHKGCEGFDGRLRVYANRDGEYTNGGHIGPLSDFVLVKRAGAETATDNPLPF